MEVKDLLEAFTPLTITAVDVDERPIRTADDADLVWVRVTWGDFKRAREAVAKAAGSE